MKQFKKYALILLVVVYTYHTNAQQAQNTAFSLKQAIEYALKNSPNYLNAELDMQNAEYRKKEITGLGLPQINGSIDLKDYLSLPTSLLPGQIFGGPEGSFIPVKFGTKYNATAGFSASQLLFNSDYIFGLKASDEFLNLQKINVYRSKNELAAGVTKAYYFYVITRDRLRVAEANVERTKATLTMSRAMNEQGLNELIDMERAEVEYNNATVDRDKAARSLINLEAVLKFQMGYSIHTPIVLSDSLNLGNEELHELATKADITGRPDIQMARGQQALLDIDVKRLKWGYLPTLAAYGSYQYNAQRNQFNLLSFDNNDPTKKWFKIALVGITLNVSIFDGLQRNYKIQQAKIASLKNINTIKMLETNAEAEIMTSSINYNSAYQNYINQKRSLDLSTHVYNVAVKKYENGVGASIEIVAAQTQVAASQVNYYSALYDMIIAKTDYLKATGTLIK
jgi:outer membrane protein